MLKEPKRIIAEEPQVPDEQCDLDYVGNGPVKMDIKYALSNSLGFGGHNASLLIKKYED